MRNQLLLSASIAILFSANAFAQNTFPASGAVGIGTITPNASSLLEITSTTKGVLLPRMTKAQRDAIVSPATGLIIFQTNSTPGLYYYSGAVWTAVSSKGPNKQLSNLTAPTAVNVDLLPGVTGTINLGSSLLSWNDHYLAGKLYLDGAVFLDNGSGTGNTFVGNTGNTTNTGINNTATGNLALFTNTTGEYNTACGTHTLRFNSTGFNNTAAGYRALHASTLGNDNTAIGVQALYSNTEGGSNTALGETALGLNTMGGSNTAIGLSALYSNKAGSNATAVGYGALYYANNTTTPFTNYNVAVGYEAMRGSVVASANTGNYNCALGYQALWSNDTGEYNTASGTESLYSNTDGIENTASGYQALYNNTSGTDNTASGITSLYSNTTGFYNTASGISALYTNTTGIFNSAFGANAYYDLASLENTVCIGYNAGGVSDVSNRIEIGNTSISAIVGQVAFGTYSDARIKDNVEENVPGLSFITRLRPVTYNLNIHRQNEMVHPKEREEGDWSGKYDIEKIKMTGFIAQEVEQAAKEAGYDFSGVEIPKNATDLYSLRYSEFVVPLVKAVQELNEENGKLKTEVEELKSIINQPMNDGAIKLETSNQQPVTLLGQNIPNPFDQSTIIPFRIPKDCNDASIVISESATGRIVTAIPISCNETHLMIEAGELSSGTYSYSLYADGVLIATKQMVLNR